MADEIREITWQRALYRLAVCALLSGCTPVASPARHEGDENNDDNQGNARSRADAGREPDAGDDPPVQTSVTRAGQACDESEARACTPGNPSRQPLQCKDGVWREGDTCSEGERCDSGECVRLARECIGRVPGEKFCDGDTIMSCSGGVSMVLERCTDQWRCVEQSGAVACGCPVGTVPVDGRCDEAISCDVERGGCDTLTTCSMRNGRRECSACPDGFTGDGIAGCIPVLTSLGRLDSALDPVFSGTTPAYRLQLSLIRAHVALQPRAAPGVTVEVNGSEVAADGEWRSSVLSFGETPLVITLTAQNGRSARYEVLAERTGAEDAFLKAMYPETNDTFGYSVAISGDTIAVGATSEDGAVAGVDGDQTNNGTSESGAVYIFVREGTTWRQQAYIKSDRPEALNYFGGAVVLDGDTLLVGEPRSTPYPTNNNNAAARPGVVHVYTRSQGEWSHRARIDSPSSEPDLFGYSLAISEDAAVIGAPYDSVNGRNAGAIYTLPRAAAWGPLTRVTPRDTTPDAVFGWSVAVQSDRLLVGAPAKSLVAEHVGKVVAYARTQGEWIEQQTFAAEISETGGCFGWSVALDNDRAAVGSPYASLFRTTPRGQAFVYERSADSWQLTKSLHADVPRDSDYFGSSVAFAGDSLLIAASGDSSGGRGVKADPAQGELAQSGAFYLFGREGTDWVRTGFVKASNAAADVSLGQAIAVSGDTIAVVAPGESTAASGVNGEARGTTDSSGAVYVFR